MSTLYYFLRYPFSILVLSLLAVSPSAWCQTPHEPGDPVQAQWIYDPANNLDIDLDGYTLVEGKTFSFRENPDGSKTNTYFDMTKTATWNSSAYAQGYLFRDLAQYSTYMNYRIHFPSGYDPNYAAGYPMIVFMHGAGERGNCWGKKCFWSSQNWRPNTNTPAAPTNAELIDKNDSGPKLMSNDLNLANGGQAHDGAIARAKGMYPDNPALPSNAWPGFVLVPQNLNGWANADPQDAIRIIRLLLKKYPIDPNRIVVHGLSDGGFGVYEIIKRAPWLFAGAIPMAPVSDAGIVEATDAGTQDLVDPIANIPLWEFQGGADTVVSPAQNKYYIDYLQDYGMNTRYTLYPDLGHSVWNNAYAEPDFFSWMLSKNKANILVRYQHTSLCSSNGSGIELRVAYGFWAYQWQRDGVDIPGATGAVYVAKTPGTYRARFSRVQNPTTDAQWNRWSDNVVITQGNETTPVITVIGTTQLPGKDGVDTVVLEGPANFKYYYWYKDGAKLNFGTLDTLASITIDSKLGSGSYTLQTAADANACKTLASLPVDVHFNAPTTINAPSDLHGVITSSSATSVDLHWIDNSNNETSFEIYRATKNSNSYSLIGVVGQDTTMFVDNGVAADSTYHYQVRAVNDKAVSAFTPDYVITTVYVVAAVDQLEKSTFTIFPIPGNQHDIQFKGNLSAASQAEVRIDVLDVNGRTCHSVYYSPEELDRGVSLDQSAPTLPTGVYVVVVKQGNAMTRQKILIY